MSLPILIPAYNPNELLVQLVDSLIQSGVQDIVVVNDGSDPECGPVFSDLEKRDRCHILHHAVNLGKGRAIKTGLNYCFLTFSQAPGVITADADGQHTAPDILRAGETFLKDQKALVLGARKFGRETPLRSLIGNTVTKYVFRALVGKKISDTQSGLRCIPRYAIPLFIGLEGEKYEYEMNMLIATKTHMIPLIEQEISTVYINDNRSSHFNPLIDSMKIYFLLLRFGLSSIFASAIDFFVFTLAFFMSGNVLASIIVARAVAGNVNFFINRRLVFRSSAHVPVAILKYYSLVIVLAGLAFLSIEALAEAGMNVILAKALTETMLFIASFSIQRDYIFGSRDERNRETL